MFLGEYEHTIDDKNRLTLPARFRDSFAGGVVLTRGLDECLDVYARGDWDSLVEARLAPLDPFSKEARDLKRFFFSAASRRRARQAGSRARPAGADRGTGGSAGRSSWQASTTTSRSGIAPPGTTTSPRSKGARTMLPNVLQRSASDHVPVLAEEVRELLAVQPGRDRRRRDLRRRRPLAPAGRRPPRRRQADRDRPRPVGRDVLRSLQGSEQPPVPLPPRRVLARPEPAGRQRRRRRTQSCSTSVSRRCSSTGRSAASRTPPTRRSTCAWTPRPSSRRASS